MRPPSLLSLKTEAKLRLAKQAPTSRQPRLPHAGVAADGLGGGELNLGAGVQQRQQLPYADDKLRQRQQQPRQHDNDVSDVDDANVQWRDATSCWLAINVSL